MDYDAPFSPSHLSITTSYRHSLRRFLPVFAGAPMSYNPSMWPLLSSPFEYFFCLFLSLQIIS
jgi:hypothetical protein